MNTDWEFPPGEESLEECIDDLHEAIGTLDRYGDEVLVFALRVHLASLLRTVLMYGRCTPEHVKELVAALEADALGVDRE